MEKNKEDLRNLSDTRMCYVSCSFPTAVYTLLLLLQFFSFSNNLQHSFTPTTSHLNPSLTILMATAPRVTHCDLRSPKPATSRPRLHKPAPVQFSILKPKPAESEAANTNNNIVLQPRLCTLRSYASDPFGAVVKIRNNKEDMQVNDDVSSFFATLSEYIESSKKSHDFEIISGRLAMVVTLTVTLSLLL